MLTTDPKHLTDEQLVAGIAALNGAERKATAALVAHLAELEARDLHVAMGFKSLYRYCRAVLHLSEHESYSRMEAAHVAQRFPVILPMIAEGLLHLTAVRLMAPHLGDENHLALLGGAIHKSKVEVKELLARWFPKADVRTSIRRVPASAGPEPGHVDVWGGRDGPPAANGVPTAATVGPERAPRKASIDPLSADTYALRLTARRATIERLRRAQEILSHAVPDGNVDEILYRALGALIEAERRAKPTATPRRRDQRQSARPADRTTPSADPASRTVAAGVEREVRARDGDQCAFVAKDGRRCEERRFLELHHRKPWIAGGGATAANISLRCRAHNRYEWKVYVAPIRAAQEVMATRSGTSEPPRPARPRSIAAGARGAAGRARA